MGNSEVAAVNQSSVSGSLRSESYAPLPELSTCSAPFYSGFSFVWLTCLIAVVPTAVFVLMDWLSPVTLASLFDSQVTPWGVFTSLFIPDDVLNKVVPNMVFLLVYSLIFMSTNQGCPEAERRLRSGIFAGVVVGSAVSANLLWIIATPLESFGASVIVYGSAGATIAFALYNIFPCTRSNRTEWSSYYEGGGWIYGLSNEFIFVGSFLLLAFSPSWFLGSFSSVNGFSHGVALLISFLATAAFLVGRDLKERRAAGTSLCLQRVINPTEVKQ